MGWKRAAEFYAYLKNQNGELVGEVNFHTSDCNFIACIGIVIEPQHRGKGYCEDGLLLLSDKARQCGIKKLRNDFEFTRKAAVKAHLKAGFIPVGEQNGICMLELDLNK